MINKDAYLEKAHAKIDEYAARLEILKAKAKSELAGGKISTQEQIAGLEKRIEDSKTRLAELAETAEDRWEDVSGRFEMLADDLGSSFRKFFKKHE